MKDLNLKKEKKTEEEGATSATEVNGEDTGRENRAKAVQLNKEIAQHAKQKELNVAHTKFQEAVQNGWANIHTYCAMMNAYVRCGDIGGAENIFKGMKVSTGAKKDVVAYTTLMKGYSAAGNVAKCDALLLAMLQANPKVMPNIRTINTYLRGCIIAGCINEAERIVINITKDLGVVPDVSCWEAVVVLLSEGLRLDRALPVIGRLKDDPSMTSGLGNMYISIARCAAMLGNAKQARKMLQAAVEVIDKEEEREIVADANDDEESEEENEFKLSQQAVTGGKKAWKHHDSADARVQSLEVYRDHKRSEMRNEITLLQEFIAKFTAGDINVAGCEYLLPLYRKIMTFYTCDTRDSIDTLAGKFVAALLQKFGYDVVLRKKLNNQDTKSLVEYELYDNYCDLSAASSTATTTETSKKKKKKVKTNFEEKVIDNSKISLPQEVLDEIVKLRRHFVTCMNNDKHIDFGVLFSAKNKHTPSTLPIKMEICSGTGEWVAKQAQHEIGVSNWVSVELRHDRVYQTFTKAVYNSIPNLSLLAGDANVIMGRHIAPESIHGIFVNYPEPPQQAGSESSEGKHLLTMEFIQLVEAALCEEGIFTILTDNLWYGKYLLRILNSLPHPRRLSSIDISDDDITREDELSDFVLYKGKPTPECGHAVDASSYFDRLWKRGKQVERYFISMRKGVPTLRVSSGPLRITQKRGAPAISTAAVGKKIKFDD